MEGRVAPLLQRPSDIFFTVYFILHIVMSILIDSQIIVPRAFFPTFLTDAMDFHVTTFKDVLVSGKPVWFTSLVVTEFVIQLPFFFLATYAFLYGRKWIRGPAIAYSAHVCTTMVPIMAEIYAAPLLVHDKLRLMGVYMPWAVIPVILLLRSLFSEPFFKYEVDVHKKQR